MCISFISKSTTRTIILSFVSKRSQLSVKNLSCTFYSQNQIIMKISKLCCRRSAWSNSESRTPVFQRFSCGIGGILCEITSQNVSFRLVFFMNVLGLSATNARWLSGLRKDLSSFCTTTLCVLGKPNQDSIFVSEARKKKVFAFHRNDDDNDRLTTLLCSLFSLSEWWWTVAADDVHSCAKHSCLN